MPTAEVFKDFVIDCAHSLPHVPDGHKCKNVHGHTYKIRVGLKGELDPVLGWVEDFALIKAAFEPIKELLDHRYINDVSGLENPTAENLAIWVWNKLKDKLPLLHEVMVFETPLSGTVYKGV
jgi:6-pyruvoyltetrahydropterin/6-carboxytetrahydropterin synthase